MKVAALQLGLYPKHPEKAVDEAERQVRAASKKDARLICMPEHWLLSRVITSRDPILKRFGRLAKELDVFLNLGASFEKRPKGTWLTSHTISPVGVVISRQDKVHLYRRENREALPGSRFGLVEVDHFKVGVIVCHDLVFPETARTVTLMGAELLVVPSLIGAKGSQPWFTYLRARALENRVPIISPNICRPPGILGKSRIVDLRYDKKEHVMQLTEIKAGQLVKPLFAELDLGSNRFQRQERLRELIRSKAIDGLYAASRSAA